MDVPELYHLPGIYEPFSAFSHLIGALVFVFLGLVLMARGRHNRRGRPYLMVYAVACVLMMSISSAFHMPPRGSPAQRVIERLDHAAIFVFIASTFTPAHGICFRGWLRWGPLCLIWTAALAGVALKVLFFEFVPEWLGQSFYLALGWLGLFAGYLLARRHGFNFIKPLLFGGIAYSIGAAIDLFRYPIALPGVIHSHELFHLTVLMGAFWHWLFVWQIAPGHRTTFDLAERRPEPIDALA